MAHPRVGEGHPRPDHLHDAGFLRRLDGVGAGFAQLPQRSADRPQLTRFVGRSDHQGATAALAQIAHAQLQFVGQLAGQPGKVGHRRDPCVAPR